MDTTDEGYCDVCSRNAPTQVAASGLGPASFAYCDQCIEHQAEPLNMIATKIMLAGGLDNFQPESLGTVTTYAEGAYQPLSYAMRVYPDLEEDIRAAFYG